MATGKFLASIALYYLFALLQVSFLAHFPFFGLTLNLILILIIIWNIFEDPQEYFGLINAGIGGFFLDIYSSHFFGFYILISLLIAFFIKLLLKRYVEIPFS